MTDVKREVNYGASREKTNSGHLGVVKDVSLKKEGKQSFVSTRGT